MQGQFPFMFGQGGADQQDIARHVQEVGLDRAFAGLMADMMGVMSMAGGGITSSNSRHQQQDEGGVGSPEEERSLRAGVTMVRDPAAPLAARVERLHKLCRAAGFGGLRPEFRAAGGVVLLVALATRDWPTGGDLAASRAAEDAVVAVRPHMHHSLRRVAVGMLAEISKYTDMLSAMQAEGFFRHLPAMLADLAPRYHYGQRYGRCYGRGQRTDQGQFVCERLVSIAANTFAVWGSSSSFSQLARGLIEGAFWPLVRELPISDPYEMAARWQDPTGAGTKLEVDVSGCYDTAHASDDEDAGPGPGGSASADTAGDKLDSQLAGPWKSVRDNPDPLVAEFIRQVASSWA